MYNSWMFQAHFISCRYCYTLQNEATRVTQHKTSTKLEKNQVNGKPKAHLQ